MPTYQIVGPCAYVQDGRLVRHRRPGGEVELDEETAAKLGGAVKPKRKPRNKPEAEPEPEPEPQTQLIVEPDPAPPEQEQAGGDA